MDEWTAFDAIEPVGALRDDWRTGMLAALIGNVNRDPKRGKPLKPEDFMPFAYRPPEPAVSAALIAEKFRALAVRGVTVTDRRGKS